MINKKSVIFFILLQIACAKQDDNNVTDYIAKYTSLIQDYQNIDRIPDINIKEGYNEIVAIPSSVILLKYKMQLIKTFVVDEVNGLPPAQIGYYNIFNFPEIGYVFNNANMWFTGSYGMTPDGNYGESLYDTEKKQILRLEKNIIANPNLKILDKILFDNSWKKLKYNEVNEKAWFEENSKKHIIYNLSDNDLGPFKDYGFITVGPIYTNEIILFGGISIKFNHSISVTDKMFLVYDYEKKIITKKIILPGTGCYNLINGRMQPKSSLDTSSRVYLMQDFKYKEEYYNSFEKLNLIVYDVLNGIMYSLIHPLKQTIDDIEVEGIAYCIGEDENIYYQLVTKTNHYIYKIEPLWEEPMEETDYNPVFFEFYPELKAEWDKL